MPIINRGDDYFQAGTYTGNGSTQTITGLRFQPDFVWIKARSTTFDHALFDAVRGSTKILNSNTTDAEGTRVNSITAFNADGFSIGSDSLVNTNGTTYVYWAWKANGAGVTNTAGTITSTVSASTISGVSIVTYEGNGTAGATVGHGLGVIPKMIIHKARNIASQNWIVYHASMDATPQNYVMGLNLTVAKSLDSTMLNNTAPTSTVWSIGTNTSVNNSGSTYVAYCFAEVAGFSRFGSFVANGSTDGSFIYTGMRPAFVLIKRTDTTSNWTILDFAREGYNVDNDPLYTNLSNAEGTTDLADLLSNGFKLRSTDASVNASGGTYVYAAFATNPFKYALAR